MTCIYGILNKLNGNQYVGSAKNFYKRKQLHLKHLDGKYHHSQYLQRAWDKYGRDMFEFVILEKVDKAENLLSREQWWIDNSNSSYNVCKIAGSSLGVKRRKSTIEKIRNANLGMKHPEWRNRIKSIAQGGENHHNWGKHLSEETCKKKSDSMKEYYKHNRHMRCLKIHKYDLSGNLIQTFDTVKEAAAEASVNYVILIRYIKGKNKNYKLVNYKYEYDK